jgi:hypothetical protein
MRDQVELVGRPLDGIFAQRRGELDGLESKVRHAGLWHQGHAQPSRDGRQLHAQAIGAQHRGDVARVGPKPARTLLKPLLAPLGVAG